MGFYLGCSAAYVTAVCYASSVVDPDILKRAPYFYDFLSDADFSQVGYLMGFMVAGFSSVRMSGMVHYDAPSIQHPFLSLLGGFLIIVGAR
jgi:hypothetical protein